MNALDVLVLDLQRNVCKKVINSTITRSHRSINFTKYFFKGDKCCMRFDCLFSPVIGLEVDHGEGQRRPRTCHIHIYGVTFLYQTSPFKSQFILGYFILLYFSTQHRFLTQVMAKKHVQAANKFNKSLDSQVYSFSS